MKKKKIKKIVLTGKGTIELDYQELSKAVLVLRAINHKLRQRIIDFLSDETVQIKEGLRKNEDGSNQATVTFIYTLMRLEQSVASQHLAVLRKVGVVTTTRDGKFIYYSLDKDRLTQISSLVEELAK